MSHKFSSEPTSLDQSKDKGSADAQTEETPSKEMALLASGVLILAIGIGGALMYSQTEDLRVESVRPISANQLAQSFPAPAMALQPTSEEDPSSPTIIPVSLDQGASKPQADSTKTQKTETVVHFDFDQATLTDEAKSFLEPQVRDLIMKHGWSVVVRGHTDPKGSEAYNKVLSIRRAEAVKEYLISLGLSDNSIGVEGLGKTEPICKETSDSCNAQNRRADLIFTNWESSDDNAEQLITKPSAEAEQDPPSLAEASNQVTESDSDTIVETVQLSESMEEIDASEPIASVTASQ